MCFVAAAISWAAPCVAQVVQGAAIERDTRVPLQGVLVSLVDAGGRVVVTVLTGDSGRFEIKAPVAGQYSVDAKRIGVRPLRTAPFFLASGERHEVSVVLDRVAHRLVEVRATGQRTCIRRPSTDARTLELWEDARAALTASVITSRRRIAGSIIRFTRDIDVRSERVLRYDVTESTGDIAHPFRSIAADELARSGYVIRGGDSYLYYAPDATVLLSDAFASSHCLRVATKRDSTSPMVGLRFEPSRYSRVTDIEGVLWLDAATSELRELRFTYRSLPHGRLEQRFGGTVHFRRLPNGEWIVDDWVIRMPLLLARSSRGRLDLPFGEPLREEEHTRVVRVREEGGTVRLNGEIANVAVSIAGVVADSADIPAAGVSVSLSAPAIATRTNALGQFSFAGIRSGTYEVTVRTPVLDSLGISVPGAMVRVPSSDARTLYLRIPQRSEIARRMCLRPPDMKRQAVIRIIVVDRETSEPLRNVQARVWWRRYEGGIGHREQHGELREKIIGELVLLDSTGAWTGCEFPGDQLVEIESVANAPLAWRDTLRSTPGEVSWRVLRVDVRRRN